MNITQYLMINLMEEFGECIQAVSKCLRFGTDHAYYEETNIERLRGEVEDAVAIIHILRHIGIPLEMREEKIAEKIEKVLANLELSRKLADDQQ
jgi:NTP pyrophosphatase (non-canonical NTP hydrolase)